MRAFLILLCSAGIAGLGAIWLLRGKSEERVSPPTNPVVAAAKKASESRVQETLAAMSAVKRPEDRPDTQLDGISLATKQKLGIAFGALSRARASVHRDEEREAILEKLAQDPEATTAAARYLSDLSLVKNHFGDKQAEARLFSIQLLKHRAKQGNPDSLWATTKVIGQQVSTSKNRDKGQERDLEDLILASVEVEGDRAFADLDKIVQRIGFHPALKKQFIAGIYFALQSRHSKQEIVERLEQIGISPKGE